MEALRKCEFMNEPLQSVLQAHGGIDRWNKFNTVSASFVTGGGLVPMKGVELPTTPLGGIASIHEEMTLFKPFGQPDRQMVFTSQRVVIETNAGEIVSDRSNPRETFAGHVLNAYWDSLHRACFNGYFAALGFSPYMT